MMNKDEPNLGVRTNCKNCSFAIYSDKTQVGCEHDRITKFAEASKEAYDEEKEFYIIDKFCNYFRDKAWGYSIKDKQKVIEESANSYLIFIDCNEIDTPKKITDFISNINYYQRKIDIILFHSKENFEYVKDNVASIARNCKKLVNISVLSEDKNVIFHQNLIKSKVFFHSNISKLENENVTFAEDIEEFTNKRLLRGYVINHKGNIFFNNHIYKAVAHLNQLYTYEDTITKLIEDSKKIGMYVSYEN